MSENEVRAPAQSGDAKLDAGALIAHDLEDLQRERRRHFVPALALVILAIGGLLVTTGFRGDLLTQPPLQLATQIALWVLCLLVLPAVGLGLVFPSRWARVGLVVLTIGLTMGASLSWQLHDHHTGAMHFGIDGCFIVQLTLGAALFILGAFSGAFVQRRRAAAVYWVAAGLGLAALNTGTWHCPNATLEHVMPSHFTAAAVLITVTAVVGLVLHRRRDATGAGD